MSRKEIHTPAKGTDTYYSHSSEARGAFRYCTQQ